MSKSYTPGLKILDNSSVTKERILPLRGKVHVNKGDLVDSDKIVASTEIPGNVQMINIANKLNVDSADVPDCMLYSEGDFVKKGDVIARSKGLFGLFKSEVKSPLDGTIGNVSNVTGQVIISELPLPVEIDSYIPGEVGEIIEKEGVVIKSKGTFIQGIIGIGGEKKGLIKLIEKDNVKSNDITDEHQNCILILKSSLNLDLYNRAIEIGVNGIVCGGIDYITLTSILGRPLGVAITGMEEVTTIVVTEGFGNVLKAERTFSLFIKNQDKFSSINGATQIRAGVLRPEIFIGSNMDSISDVKNFDEDDLVISLNSQVRIIREPYFGEIGVVVDLPAELEKINTETMSRIAVVEFGNGNRERIPRANLEVILSD